MGHVAREDALAFGWTLSVGVGRHHGPVRQLPGGGAAGLHRSSSMSCVYTLWLKRRTPQNIVIGGLAGALPPAIGWAAVTGIAVAGAAGAGGDHLPLDAAAFLGAVAVALRRLCPRRRADAAGGQGQARTPAGRSCSIRWCWCRWAWCRPSSAWAACSIWWPRPAWACWMLLEAFATWRETRRSQGARRRKRLFGVSLLYLFVPVRRPDRRASARHLPPLWT